MRNPLRKRRAVSEKLLLAAPGKQIEQDQIRDSIVSLINTAKNFLREPEAKDTDIEEDICWMLLLLPILDGIPPEAGLVHETSWWYTTIGREIQSDKQMAILASALNMAAA